MGSLNLKSLLTRTLSAAVLIPVVLFCVYSGGWPLYIMLAILASICIYEWVGMARKTERVVVFSLLGSLFIIVGFGACLLIRDLGFEAALMLLLIVWSTDIGAYFCGSLIGGKKLAPQISPNKTWSGFIGGALIAVLIALVATIYSPFVADTLFLVAMVIFVSISGQVGDLMESWMKRNAGVKDSGAIIPGHGGLLDRVDSLLLAAPAFIVAVYVLLLLGGSFR